MPKGGEQKMTKIYKPGELSPFSGEAQIVGPRGGKTGEERTVDRGERFPPTPESGQGFEVSRRAHNRAGHGK